MEVEARSENAIAETERRVEEAAWKALPKTKYGKERGKEVL